MDKGDLILHNNLFSTQPLVVHAHGSHSLKPHWEPVKSRFFSTPQKSIGLIADLTIITCNNGNAQMGILEKSLDHLGIPYKIYGQGIETWVNSIHKPICILKALGEIETMYTMYIDSRDAIVINDLHEAVRLFKQEFDCKLLFGADRINWPPLKEFEKFEKSIAPNGQDDFIFLNGGAWIGETKFSYEFFKIASETKGVDKVAESEQGILKQLLINYYPQVQLDYKCRLFQNIGFVFGEIFSFSFN